MKLPTAWRREPTASRLLMVGALVVSGSVAAAMVVEGHGSWVGLLPPVILFSIIVVLVVVMVRGVHPSRLSFDVAGDAFLLPPIVPFAVNLLLPLIMTSFLVGSSLSRPDPWSELLIVAPVVLLLAPMVVMVWWRGSRCALTPTGIEWRTPFNSLKIPWDTLAPGGPPRPPLGSWSSRIRLTTVRPDLVVKRGWLPFSGSREFPILVSQAAVHPWLIVDAIRWYAEHPEHRAGIGTQAEHDRLLAALAPGLPTERRDVVRPPRPQTVTAAAWLTCLGVGWGLLFAGWNLFVALAFHDRIVAAQLAANREEELATGFKPGKMLIGGAAQSTGAAIAGLVLAVVAGIGALLLVRSMNRGSDVARTGLIVLCGAIVVWAFVGSWATTPMLLADNPDSLGGFMILAYTGNQGACAVVGITICVLLMLDPANRYFRPTAAPP